MTSKRRRSEKLTNDSYSVESNSDNERFDNEEDAKVELTCSRKSLNERKSKTVEDNSSILAVLKRTRSYNGTVFSSPIHYFNFLKFIYERKLYSLANNTITLSPDSSEEMTNHVYKQCTLSGKELFLKNLPIFLKKHINQILKDLENWHNYGIGPVITPDRRILLDYVNVLADTMMNITAENHIVDYVKYDTTLFTLKYKKQVLFKIFGADLDRNEHDAGFNYLQSVINRHCHLLKKVLTKKLISKVGNGNNKNIIRTQSNNLPNTQLCPVTSDINKHTTLCKMIVNEVIKNFSMSELNDYVEGRNENNFYTKCMHILKLLHITEDQINDIINKNRKTFIMELKEQLKNNSGNELKMLSNESSEKMSINPECSRHHRSNKFEISTSAANSSTDTTLKQTDESVDNSDQTIVISDDDDDFELETLEFLKPESTGNNSKDIEDVTDDIFITLMNLEVKWDENKDKHLVKFILKHSDSLNNPSIYNQLLEEYPAVFQGLTSSMLKKRTHFLGSVRNYFYLMRLCGCEKIENDKQKAIFIERIEKLRKLMICTIELN